MQKDLVGAMAFPLKHEHISGQEASRKIDGSSKACTGCVCAALRLIDFARHCPCWLEHDGEIWAGVSNYPQRSADSAVLYLRHHYFHLCRTGVALGTNAKTVLDALLYYDWTALTRECVS